MLLGCVCDDFTGSSDLGNNLSKGGMRVTQYCGIPTGNADPAVEAGVVALKTRSVAPDEAIAQSLAALEWLLAQGAQQIYFKYCSSFDSTREGNIGPVAEALAERLDEEQVIVCPAFPDAGRTVYQGNLFVFDRPLNESGMQNHPLTPMVDADIRRWLGYQSCRDVAHLSHAVVSQGAAAIRAALDVLEAPSLVVADALDNADLVQLARAVSDRKLITGGSGLALGLPAIYRERQKLSASPAPWHGEQGAGAVLSGSCSETTLTQVRHYAENHPALPVSADAVMSGDLDAGSIARWVKENIEKVPLVYTSADHVHVSQGQSTYDAAALAKAIEIMFSELAQQLVKAGVKRLVLAGGETSGAVVEGLGIDELAIGPEIAPGVPAVRATDGRSLVLALKSGNFGSKDFFEQAMLSLERV